MSIISPFPRGSTIIEVLARTLMIDAAFPASLVGVQCVAGSRTLLSTYRVKEPKRYRSLVRFIEMSNPLALESYATHHGVGELYLHHQLPNMTTFEWFAQLPSADPMYRVRTPWAPSIDKYLYDALEKLRKELNDVPTSSPRGPLGL